tara:strand:+ start:2075 stop:2707 length:633 start_codon:yes stop_codon:yes gene_type:complete
MSGTGATDATDATMVTSLVDDFRRVSVGAWTDEEEAAILDELLDALPGVDKDYPHTLDDLTKQCMALAENQQNALRMKRKRRIQAYVRYMVDNRLTADQMKRNILTLSEELETDPRILKVAILHMRNMLALRGDLAAMQSLVANHPLPPGPGGPPSITLEALKLINEWSLRNARVANPDMALLNDAVSALARAVHHPLPTVWYWLRAHFS